MAKSKTIVVKGIEVVFYEKNKEDFISLTDIARHRDKDRSDYILQNWMRNTSTIEFIGLWESFNNHLFEVGRLRSKTVTKIEIRAHSNRT